MQALLADACLPGLSAEPCVMLTCDCVRDIKSKLAQAFYQAAKLRAEQGEPVEAALCWMGVGAARPGAACMCLQNQNSTLVIAVNDRTCRHLSCACMHSTQ